MKKVTLSLLVIVSLFSCKEKLPSNISTSLYFANESMNELNELESIIGPLSDSDISKLSKDSLRTLYFGYKFSSERYEQYDNELDEILKYNPEYSEHPDMVKVYRKNSLSYVQVLENFRKIEDRYYSID